MRNSKSQFRDTLFPSRMQLSYNLTPMITVDALNNITVEDRLRGAVWGQFVGDAAALGTHWIYDLRELQQLYPGGINGFEAPKEGHYHFKKRPGDQKHGGSG
jgi:hypothetical protein